MEWVDLVATPKARHRNRWTRNRATRSALDGRRWSAGARTRRARARRPMFSDRAVVHGHSSARSRNTDRDPRGAGTRREAARDRARTSRVLPTDDRERVVNGARDAASPPERAVCREPRALKIGHAASRCFYFDSEGDRYAVDGNGTHQVGRSRLPEPLRRRLPADRHRDRDVISPEAHRGVARAGLPRSVVYLSRAALSHHPVAGTDCFAQRAWFTHTPHRRETRTK